MSKQTSNKFSPEVRSRAVRLVLDHDRSIRRGGRRSFRLPQDRLHGGDAASG